MSDHDKIARRAGFRSSERHSPFIPDARPLSLGDDAMKVMVLVKASKQSEAGVLPDGQLLAEMGKYNEEPREGGILMAGEGLHPSSKGVRNPSSRERTRTVID